MPGPRRVTRTINLSDRDAVRFWTSQLKCTESLLRTALRNVGPDTERVRSYLEAMSVRSSERDPLSGGRFQDLKQPVRFVEGH